MTADDDRYLSPPEMATYTSLSERNLRRLTADPVHPLPVHFARGRRLYKRSEFDQWLREEDERRGPRPVDTAYRTALLIRGHQR